MNRSDGLTILRAFGLASAIFLFVGCASQEESAGNEPPPLTVEEILNSTLDESAYGEVSRCLPSHTYDRVEILDDRHLVFYGRRNQVWLNKLRHKCPGLRRRDALKFDITGSRLCELDSVTAIESRGFGIDETSAKCALGSFQEIPAEQAALLMEQIQSRR